MMGMVGSYIRKAQSKQGTAHTRAAPTAACGKTPHTGGTALAGTTDLPEMLLDDKSSDVMPERVRRALGAKLPVSLTTVADN